MTDENAREPTVYELLDLTDRVAFVTGATGYLGHCIARALAEAGATVVISSRELQRAEMLVDGLPVPQGQEHSAVELDYLAPTSIEDAFAHTVDSAGRVDILVNNGHAASAEDWTSVSHEQFTQQLANASGYFLLARFVRDHAVSRGQPANIIMLGSMYGLVGSYPDAYESVCPASPVAYHVLKGGIAQMTRHLAVYWAKDRVRVNCLCPGPFPNPDRAPKELIDRLKDHVPLQRMGRPYELKGAAVLLASDASSFMTGQLLVVDGGWTAW